MEFKKQDVYDYLDARGIEYFAYDHEPVQKTRDYVDLPGTEDGRHCKNLFLCNRQATRFYLACFPAHKRYSASEVSRQIASSRLHFASDEDLSRILGLAAGYVSPFGLLNDSSRLTVFALDEDLLQEERLSFHPNANDASMVLRREEFLRYLSSLRIEPKLFCLRSI